jgi:hypothetical protein
MRYFMDLVELGARSMDLVDLEFLKLRFLAEKNLSGAIFLICGALLERIMGRGWIDN